MAATCMQMRCEPGQPSCGRDVGHPSDIYMLTDVDTIVAGPTGPVTSLPELAAADDCFAGVLGLADSLLASRAAAARALARALYAALFRLHDDAAQRERLLRDLVGRAAAWPGPAAGAAVACLSLLSAVLAMHRQTEPSLR